jgi:tetratricopeptide (TPR) repeat protein
MTPTQTLASSTADINQHAVALCSAGQFAEALSIVTPLLDDATLPNDTRADALNIAGACSLALRNVVDAENHWRQCLRVKPGYAEVYGSLGSLIRSLGRLSAAKAMYRQLVSVRPDQAGAHHHLGNVLYGLGYKEDAEASYREALALRPDYAEAHYNLGIALFRLERFGDAEQAYHVAIRWQPGMVHAHNNLGCVLRVLDRFPEAIDAFRQALAVCPELAEAHSNLGNALVQLSRLPEAESAYRQALALRADYGDARFCLAVLLLRMGRFEEGWRQYECRYDEPSFVHHQSRAMLSCPQWSGETLAGKSLLVWQEDGLGDMLQLSRYFALLKAQGATHIAFACAPALHRLMARIDGVDAVLDHGAAMAGVSSYDCWTSLLSAPLYLRTTLNTIPRATQFVLEPALVEQWRPALDALPPGSKIGLVWKGNAKHHNDANRSIPSLATLAPLWSVPGLSFVSLQKGRARTKRAIRQPLSRCSTSGRRWRISRTAPRSSRNSIW